MNFANTFLLCIYKTSFFCYVYRNYPHLYIMVSPYFCFLWIFNSIFLSFYHHLLYNNLVIQGIQFCISRCNIHLHPLLFVFENLPVTLKMYFLYSVVSHLPTYTMPDTAASEYLLSASEDNGSSWHFCFCCLNALSCIYRFSGY